MSTQTSAKTIVRQFIDRAMRIETLTEQRLAHGTGTRLSVLEAKAARLQGQLDLKTLAR